MKLTLSKLQINLLLIVISALLFIPFLGAVHLFDWDEINFAESAREMLVTGDYMTVQINFQPFWEKPPLFIWMQVLSMKTFGVNEFAARFPNAICGIVTVLVLFNIGAKLRDKKFGLIWVAAYIGTILPFFYFKSGIIDPWFNLFIFLGIYFLTLYFSAAKNKIQNIVFAGIFTGLAVLTKGPVAILVTAITTIIFLIVVRFKVKMKTKEILTGIFVLILVGGFWFILQIAKGNYKIIAEFIDYQIRLFQTKDAGHGGFWGYHFIVLLIGVFPSSIWAIKGFQKNSFEKKEVINFKRWMIILFFVVLVLFSIVQTKIIHYSSLAYFPISFLAALFVFNSDKTKTSAAKWQNVLVILISTIYSLFVIALQFLETYKQKLLNSNLITDLFTRETLKTNVHWSGYELVVGVLFLLAVCLVFTFVNRANFIKRALLLWAATMVFTSATLILIVPKTEEYSQRALIDFFKSKANQDVYLRSIYFKSYATYFYGKTLPPQNKNYYNDKWLLLGDIDKDTYFATEIHKENGINGFPDIKKIGQKGGYVFYLRKAKK